MRTMIVPLLLLAATSSGCAYGYKEAAVAAMSPLSAPAEARDQILKLDLRRVIVESDSFSGLSLEPDVYMERGFIVGFVDSPQQAQQVIDAGQSVGGLRSLDTYLPVRPATDSKTSDLELKADIRGRIALDRSLVSTRYTIECLDGVVVLLGVTMTEEERDTVAEVAGEASGVKDVKSMLLVVEPGYGSLRPHLR